MKTRFDRYARLTHNPSMSYLRLFGPTAFCLLWCLSAAAGGFQVGDNFTGFQAADQAGGKFTFKPGDAKFLILNTPGESGTPEDVKDPGWFEKNHALMLVNISDLSALKRRIARSRLSSKPYRLLVLEDAALAERLPKQSGKMSVLSLDDQGKITAVRYAAPGKELQALFSNAK